MTTSASQLPDETSAEGRFVRQRYTIRERISADGSSGFVAEPGRYHLYVSYACPWANRTTIVRQLLGLEDIISVSVVDPIRDERGWAFREGEDHGPDPVNGFDFLSEAYRQTDPDYSSRVTVPCIWDRQSGRLVSNNYPDMTVDFELAFRAFHREDAPDLYPEALRAEIDAVSEGIYHDVNNGVYKAGFASSQTAYEEAYDALFTRLDELERRLSEQRYLVGEQLTEADVRLFTTLVRFDSVYYSHFKCNRQRLVDYPNLWSYTRDLYARPAFHENVNMDHIKRHYYMTHDKLNPSRVVPKGPDINWFEPHDRERLS